MTRGASYPGAHVWTRDPIVAFDTETTGLDPLKGHRIVELGLVRAEGLEPVESLDLLLNPGVKALEAFASSRAAEVNRFDPAELRDAPTFEQVLPTVRRFLRGHPLLAYNAPFDVAFLRAELNRASSETALPESLDPGNALDPLVWVRDVDRFVRSAPYRARGLKRHSLGPAAERRGLAPEGDLHRAGTDARLALRLAAALRAERDLPGWTARLLRRQARRRAAQDAERRAYRASLRGAP